MKTINHMGTVLLQFEDEREIRFLRMLLEVVDRKKLSETAAKLSIPDLDKFNGFVTSGLTYDLFESHLPECKGKCVHEIIDEVSRGALEAYGVKGVSIPA